MKESNNQPNIGNKQIADAILSNLVDKNKIFDALKQELQTPAPKKHNRWRAPLRAAMSMAAMLLLTVAVLHFVPPVGSPTLPPDGSFSNCISEECSSSSQNPVESQPDVSKIPSTPSEGSYEPHASSGSDSSDVPPQPLTEEETVFFLEFASKFNKFGKIITSNMQVNDAQPTDPDVVLNVRTHDDEFTALADIRILLDSLFIPEVATAEYYRLTEGERPRYTEVEDVLLMDVNQQKQQPILRLDSAMSVSNQPFRRTLRVLISDPHNPNEYYADFSFRKVSEQWLCTAIPLELAKVFES